MFLYRDFESWDPIWERNGGNEANHFCDNCGVYQNASRALVRSRHPTWNASQVEAAAKEEWETATREYFEQTLLLSHKLRPFAKFGFYNWPAGSNKIASGSCGGTSHGCNDVTATERGYDDRMHWLWAASGALFPSNYICSVGGGPWGQGNGTAEAMRVAANHSVPVFPFIWSKKCLPDPYYSNFVNASVMQMDIDIIQSFGTAGVMIYGEAPHDASTKEQCAATKSYIESTLGPQMLASQQATESCRAAQCSGNGNCARAIEFERMAPRNTRCVCDSGFVGEKCDQHQKDVNMPIKLDDGANVSLTSRKTILGGKTSSSRRQLLVSLCNDSSQPVMGLPSCK